MLFFLMFVGGPVFGILYQGWRAWDFSNWWRPAQANTIGSDYTEVERLDDTKPFAWLIPHPFKDGRTGRRTKVRIEFTDEGGHLHRAGEVQMVRRGTKPKPTMQIYYDTRNPDRVDSYGATGAKIWMVIWTIALAYILCRLHSGAPMPA